MSEVLPWAGGYQPPRRVEKEVQRMQNVLAPLVWGQGVDEQFTGYGVDSVTRAVEYWVDRTEGNPIAIQLTAPLMRGLADRTERRTQQFGSYGL